MEEVSTGALVPLVKPVMTPSTSVAPTEAAGSADEETAEEVGVSNMDKDWLCPICMQIIKDAFLTACGHSFCYMCIITHLQNKSDCPCCGVYLTNNQIFPNRLLDKLLKKTSAQQISKTASPVEQFHHSLEQGCEVSVKELDTLLSVLTEKKRKMEQDEAERNMKILMEFLNSLKMQKVDELNEFNDLQQCYLQKRRQLVNKPHKQDERNTNVIHREGYSAGLADFQSVLTTFSQYSRLKVIAELRHGDLFHSANIVSSIEFDCDDELFATAGVSRRIKVFDFSSVVNERAEVHCPVVEMSTRSKLSCLSWNKCTKNHIASSDYEGIVTVWDVNTRQSVMEYEEHEKRAWSVDFSRTEPSRLVSGSDDCKVKVWCTNQEASVLNIDMKANICCVKYNPGSSIYIAVGSADHHIHYYDLRNTSHPLHIFSGHKKAVSYVKFLSNNELASASTDSTLRLWDVKENLPVRTFRGHTNEKNFVGLSVNSEYISCGSETNDVFVYHKEISKPVTWHKFGSPDVDDLDDDVGPYFISAVCWKSDSPTMLTANSQGTIKVLTLSA
ncbi:E3 ubiquitin-protein ligase COP1-like isoform X3 [Vitis riparia]|uniref:E3 ubiquitin-protein ligase COP1-like isoform X3 n=1 Tax=Vitis riparia TaxID=96939 RepID=UPI00155A07CC|nr:E3 ubiquitin-protein ligase COP1-like isoform X3 [Vitis riparia]